MSALSGPGIHEYKGKEEGGEEALAEEAGDEWEGWGVAPPSPHPPTLTQALLSSSPKLTAQLLPRVCCPGILIMSQESGSGL